MKHTLSLLFCLLCLTGCGTENLNQPDTMNTATKLTPNQKAQVHTQKITTASQVSKYIPEPKIITSQTGAYIAELKEVDGLTTITLTDTHTNTTTVVAQSTKEKTYQKNVPTDVWKFFGPNDRYLEYTVVPFEPIPQKLFVYDRETNQSFIPAITGFIKSEHTFWTTSGYYIICSTGGGLDGWGPSITVVRPPQWDDAYFIYPTDANTTDTEKKKTILLDVAQSVYADISTCSLQDNTLTYTLTSGTQVQFPLVTLDIK